MKSRKVWGTLHPFFERGDIMGRSVANEGFIRALLSRNPYDEYHFFLADTASVDFVRDSLAEAFPLLASKGAFRVATRYALPDAVAAEDYAVFHLSDCITDTVPLLRLRNAVSRSIFPVTGTTHSLSYARYPLHFFDQMWQGVTKRDAVIATSRAGLAAVAAMFAAFRNGYGLDASWRSPRLERIPLGISPQDFPTPEEKAALGADTRKRYAIPPGHLVLLVFARISHYSKMDVLPLFRALVRAEKQGLAHGGYTLVLAGWQDSDAASTSYATIAGQLGISFQIVPSPDDAARKGLFAAADIFLSPVDNPQETFGLTMLEAGVSGLPVVASDFDGYRDIVLDGETGFLASTLGPGSTPETDALSGVWFDNQQHLQLAQQSVVSVPCLARAVADLATNPALRARFGAAARQRVLEEYTWDSVATRHVALWNELASIPVQPPAMAHPLHPGYPSIFGGYYSRIFDQNTSNIQVRWSAFGEAVYRGRDFPAVYGGVERLVSMDALKKMLFLARKPVRMAALLTEDEREKTTPAAERAAFLILWALKHDLLEEVS